jgi:hypothetical protein
MSLMQLINRNEIMHSPNSDMQQTYVAIELIKRVFVLY